MITLNEIKLALIKKLRNGTGVKNIYGEEINKKSFPLLQISIMPNTFRTAAAGYHTDKNILIDIIYMEEDFTSYSENYQMLETIDRLIRPVLSVGERNFTVENASMEITDYVGHYKFFLEFTDSGTIISSDTTVPTMEELGMRL